MIDFAALKRANEPLNAFVEWVDDAAFGQGPLAGVTVGVKANIAVRGMAWTGGLEAHRARIAERDAETVARLRVAGAAIIGTTNLEEAALGAVTRNPHYGFTQNPHRIGFTAGGSSGGSGAAVAAGLCDAALGTDTMGSIRIPAAYCGIYGFKPANGRVSQDGLELAEPSLDAIGPLARSLDMLERVARAMSDFGEGAANEVVALDGTLTVDCDYEVLEAFARAVETVSVRQEIAFDWPLSRIRFAGFIATSKTLAAHLADVPALSPALERLLGYGPRRAAEDWAEDQKILDQTAARLRDTVAGGHMLLLPTAPQAAFSHNSPAPANQADFTCLANIAGLPAISVHAGWSDDGLPVALQLVGASGHEAGLFAAARVLDRKVNAYRAPPNFFEGEAP